MSKYIYIILTIISLKLAAGEAIIYENKIHTDSVDSLCVKGDKIYTASFDGTIKRTIDNESKIIGKHKDWVRKIICTGSNIISASNDGYITVWNGVKKISSVQAHSWWVTDIALSDNKIVSVSLDETVKVWSYPELKLLYSHKLYGSNKHYSVVVNNGRAFIGATNGNMNVLDINTYKWIRKRQRYLEAHSVFVSATKSDKEIFFGASDGNIIKVNSASLRKVLQRKISNFPLKAITLSQGYLYIGDSDGVLQKINIENFNEYSVINHSSEAVRAITIDNNFIYAGYDNGYIRIFNKKEKILGNK